MLSWPIGISGRIILKEILKKLDGRARKASNLVQYRDRWQADVTAVKQSIHCTEFPDYVRNY
jgi:hypothetical protein